MAAAALIAMSAAFPAALPAQEPTDSLIARLRRLEAAVTTLERQVAEQAEAGVATRSGARLTVSGRVALHTFANSRRVNNVDNPQIALPDAPAPGRGGGMTMRHTRLRLAVSGGAAFGASTAADLDVDFHGGQVASSGGRHFPLIRLRTARAFMFWDAAELMIGQETPLLSDLNPESPAAIGTPAFAGAGNLWLWLPQLRFTAYASRGTRAGIQAAVLAPTSSDPAASFDTDYDLAERAARPFLQARAFARFGEEDSRSEIGCGAHQGWLVPGVERVSSTAVACDLLLRVATSADVRGEFFSGQSVRGLGGGGIGQNFTAAGEPVRTTGGWAQLNLRPADLVGLGAGCGADHPRGTLPRRRNDACALYVAVEPVGAFQVGAEVRRLRTEHASGRYTSDHVTLTLAWGF